jgi:hypothetical protein
MLNKWIKIGSLACVLSLTTVGRTQALPTATGRGLLQVGGGYSIAKPDYAQGNLQGFSGFADFDLGLHWGLEADAHILSIVTPHDVAENSYLIGPRIILPHGRFKLYGKVLLGIGDLVVQNPAYNIGHPAGTSFAYAAGGGLDIAATHRIVIRAIDFEYQHWNYQSGLTPSVLTIGLAYRIR